jgi:hypothetical protein
MRPIFQPSAAGILVVCIFSWRNLPVDGGLRLAGGMDGTLAALQAVHGKAQPDPPTAAQPLRSRSGSPLLTLGSRSGSPTRSETTERLINELQVLVTLLRVKLHAIERRVERLARSGFFREALQRVSQSLQEMSRAIPEVPDLNDLRRRSKLTANGQAEEISRHGRLEEDERREGYHAPARRVPESIDAVRVKVGEAVLNRYTMLPSVVTWLPHCASTVPVLSLDGAKSKEDEERELSSLPDAGAGLCMCGIGGRLRELLHQCMPVLDAHSQKRTPSQTLASGEFEEREAKENLATHVMHDPRAADDLSETRAVLLDRALMDLGVDVDALRTTVKRF